MKIFKLFISENIKTWKKFSTKVLLVIVLLSIMAVLGITKLMQKLDNNVTYTREVANYNEENLKSQIEYLKSELENDSLDEVSKQNIQKQIEQYQLCLDYNIDGYGSTWRNDIVEQIVDAKMIDDTEKAEKLIKLLKEDNFNEYIEIQRQSLKESLKSKSITEQEYNDEILVLDLKEKYEIGKDEQENTWKNYAIIEIETNQKSLRTGINQQTRKVLKAEEKQELEDAIKIDIYRLENNIPTAEQGSDNNYRMRYEMMAPTFVVAVISIIAIIIAGGAISTETSEGTIKFWALTPNKRWKILTAKILSLIFYILI